MRAGDGDGLRATAEWHALPAPLQAAMQEAWVRRRKEGEQRLLEHEAPALNPHPAGGEGARAAHGGAAFGAHPGVAQALGGLLRQLHALPAAHAGG